MPSNRKIILANGEYYHLFNRGVEKRNIFMSTYDFRRAVELLQYYHFNDTPLRYSKFSVLEKVRKQQILESLKEKNVEVVAYCMMDNHFHFLVKQVLDNGISKFMANFTNGYTKYFNTKYQRVGPLFQGPFKSVHIATDEQLLHVSRYIHLNPVLGFKLPKETLASYQWSSYGVYINEAESWFNKQIILGFFARGNPQVDYANFVMDQADYAKSFKSIEQLVID